LERLRVPASRESAVLLEAARRLRTLDGTRECLRLWIEQADWLGGEVRRLKQEVRALCLARREQGGGR
jgi:hypothetical protein